MARVSASVSCYIAISKYCLHLMVNAAVWSDAFSVRSTFLLSDMIWFRAIVFSENGDCLKLDRKTSASGIRKYTHCQCMLNFTAFQLFTSYNQHESNKKALTHTRSHSVSHGVSSISQIHAAPYTDMAKWDIQKSFHLFSMPLISSFPHLPVVKCNWNENKKH